MKILVALQNQDLKQKLDEMYGDQVYVHDISYMEGVIEFLSQSKEEYIVITRYQLDGNLTDRMYVKQLRLASPKSRIIYLIPELTNEWKSFLFANEIFNIIEGNSVSMEVIQENIEEDRGIVYKVKEEKQEFGENQVLEEITIKNQIISKQLIAIYGTSGSGKSTFAGVLAKTLVKQLGIPIGLLDMDIQNPAIDILNNIEENRNGLSAIVEEVDKREEISKIIRQYMVTDKQNRNLWYMTNNVSIFECQNTLCNRYYQKIYQSVEKFCDYTIVDLPSSPFLDVVPYTLGHATKIFFVVNPNYISIRQAIKYLDLMTKIWDISPHSIRIVVNKQQRNSLDNTQIQSMLQGYQVCCNIAFQREEEGYINGAICNRQMALELENIYSFLEIKDNVVSGVEKRSIRKNNGVWGNLPFYSKKEKV